KQLGIEQTGECRRADAGRGAAEKVPTRDLQLKFVAHAGGQGCVELPIERSRFIHHFVTASSRFNKVLATIVQAASSLGGMDASGGDSPTRTRAAAPSASSAYSRR